MWACAACVGPAIGPMISGFSVTAENWHWALWEILWLAGPTFIVMFIALPETNAGTILLQRARRLRSSDMTSSKLAAQSEFDQGSLTFAAVAKEALIKPFELNFLDPSIAFTSIYTGLLYSLVCPRHHLFA
jgi:DHA1 family multidrug resistance protein-like MFS transporter